MRRHLSASSGDASEPENSQREGAGTTRSHSILPPGHAHRARGRERGGESEVRWSEWDRGVDDDAVLWVEVVCG